MSYKQTSHLLLVLSEQHEVINISSVIIYGMDVHVIQIFYEHVITEDGRINIALRQNPAPSAR